MKQLPLLLTTFLLILVACNRKPQCDIPYDVEDELCELYAAREYPYTSIPPDALAYYTANIEGKPTSFSEKNEGIAFSSGFYTYFKRSNDSISSGSLGLDWVQVFGFGYEMVDYAPFDGRNSGILTLSSPELPENMPRDSFMSMADQMFSVGEKAVNVTNAGYPGWSIDLEFTYIDHPREPRKRSFQMNTYSAFKQSDFNRLAITRVEKEDRGNAMRYHLWFDFQCDLYWAVGPRWAESVGYWGKVENGKARFYIDLIK
jgi:hypothetical protein